jgi:uncharacterized membrane protein YraQ (UPF0718 family)
LFLLGACLLVSAFGWVLNLIAIGLGLAAVVLVGGVVGLTLRHYHRWLSSARLPAWERIGHVQPQRQVNHARHPGPQQVVQDGGQHLHIYPPAGMGASEFAAMMRQIGRG